MTMMNAKLLTVILFFNIFWSIPGYPQEFEEHKKKKDKETEILQEKELIDYKHDLDKRLHQEQFKFELWNWQKE